MARQYAVSGYVRNLPDGTVELVVQGNSGAIADFVLRISEHFHDNISQIVRGGVGDAGAFTGFEIRF
jgi:acylphosphatase